MWKELQQTEAHQDIFEKYDATGETNEPCSPEHRASRVGESGFPQTGQQLCCGKGQENVTLSVRFLLRLILWLYDLTLEKNSMLLKEWSDSTAFTHSFSGYMWIVIVTIRCGRWRHFSTRPGAVFPHVGTLRTEPHFPILLTPHMDKNPRWRGNWQNNRLLKAKREFQMSGNYRHRGRLGVPVIWLCFPPDLSFTITPHILIRAALQRWIFTFSSSQRQWTSPADLPLRNFSPPPVKEWIRVWVPYHTLDNSDVNVCRTAALWH